MTDFSLQTDLWRYRPHDVSILMNRNPILNLYNTIPQGRYINAFPPKLLNYSQEGAAGNAVQVHTRHMNGGHYVVVSDFTVAMELREPLRLAVCGASEADAQARAAAKAAELTCEATWEVCPNVVILRMLDPETGSPKSQFFRGDRIAFEIQALNPDSIEHVMNLAIHMDDNPEDASPAVINKQPLTLPAYSYATGQYLVETPAGLPDGRIYVQVVLSDDLCQSETTYAYSFILGTPLGPIPWVTDGGIYATDHTSLLAEWGRRRPTRI